MVVDFLRLVPELQFKFTHFISNTALVVLDLLDGLLQQQQLVLVDARLLRDLVLVRIRDICAYTFHHVIGHLGESLRCWHYLHI